MKTSTVLKKAKALLETKGWTKGHLAEDKDGVPTHSLSTRATCFCAIGAIERACGREPFNALAVGPAIDALTDVLPSSYAEPADYNDAPRRTKAQVLALFDRAIKLAEELEKQK